MSNVLVTGGTGFVGNHLVRRLLQDGHHVTFTGRDQDKAKPLVDMGAKFVCHAFAKSSDLTKMFAEVDAVMHCAAKSSPWGPKNEHMQVNWHFTKQVADACLKSGVRRLVHVSTSSVYFDYQDRLNLKETDSLPEVAANHYSASKVLAEGAVMDAFARGLDTVILRPRGIFGPGDEAIVPRLMRANRKIGVPLIRDGQAISDITYVDNLVDAMVLAMTAPPLVSGKIYNITNGETLSVIALLEMLFGALDRPLKLRPLSYELGLRLSSTMEVLATLLRQEPLFTRYTLSLLSFSQTLDLSAARSDLNYQPRVTLVDGFKKYAESLRAQKEVGKVKP
ncbi:MAG: NAD-dependent epimerase/dehydratase family protein [Candidatus Obscuribacter sp.]|nr:NAD-dependent epimerase/dehydratase family protein [Candidatus Obscuribacter sp.]MBP6593330.1 NAD-dependent epimerase/dehydratase family protein [Candidatus Obscuribacter sp.]